MPRAGLPLRYSHATSPRLQHYSHAPSTTHRFVDAGQPHSAPPHHLQTTRAHTLSPPPASSLQALLAQLEAIDAAESSAALLGHAAARALTAAPTTATGGASAGSTKGQSDDDDEGAEVWEALEGARPAEVQRGVWLGMFEFVAWKLTLLMGPHQLLPFARDLCDPGRFAQLTLKGGGT